MRNLFCRISIILLSFLLFCTMGYGQVDSIPPQPGGDTTKVDTVPPGKYKAFMEKAGRTYKKVSKYVAISGSLGANLGFYKSFGTPNRRDPFQYLFTGNLNIKLFGMIDVPFTAQISQQQASFRQPFNQYGISPSYKWATAHIGYRNMNFSEFTLAGHTFLGGGIELSPGNWRVSAMFGQLRRPVDEATSIIEGVDPAYRRLGFGVKLGYEAKGDMVAISVFKAKDILTSIDLPIETDVVLPEDNLVIGITGKKKLFKKLTLEVDAALSALSRDHRSPETKAQGIGAAFGPFFKYRSSSQVTPALNTKLSYKGKFYKIGLQYRRVDAGYRTLGAYFFNNDIEQGTVNLSFSFLKGKLNLSGKVGGQRNDLNADKATRDMRIIGSGNVSLSPSPKWVFSVNYSNFSSFLRVQRDLLSDSLNFYQVTQNAGFNMSHQFGSETQPQALAFSAAYQGAVGRKEYSIDPENASDFFNLALNHNVVFGKGLPTLSSSVSFAHSISAGSKTTFFGPVVSLTQSYWNKRGRASYRVSFQQVLLDGKDNGAVMVHALNSSLQVFKKHGVNLGMQYLFKTGNNKFSELRGMFGYVFQF